MNKIIEHRYNNLMTLEDLENLVKECSNFPKDTIISIDENKDLESSDVVHVIADTNSIMFFNW